jgi:hypothetical protein
MRDLVKEVQGALGEFEERSNISITSSKATERYGLKRANVRSRNMILL